MKLLLLICLLITVHARSQTDILLLKKRGATQKTWVRGSYIKFKFISDEWVEGEIKKMQNDSLWVNMYSVHRVPDYFGFPKLDTAFYGLLKVHISEIKAFPLPDKAGKYFSNGSFFTIGGLGYMFLNIANGIILNEPVFDAANLSKLGVAAGVAGIGFLLSSTQKTEIRIRGKYSLQLISGTKKE